MEKRITVKVLGTGTSTGVPLPGCQCEICTSTDPKNKRLRSSIALIIENPGHTDDEPRVVIVDTTPDFRYQCLRAKIKRVDAVLYTHYHADHIFGLDDLRSFNFTRKMKIPLFADHDTAADLRKRFNYVFNIDDRTKWSTPPELDLFEIAPYKPLDICGVNILPLTVRHGSIDILGFKIGNFAYLTDCNFIPEQTIELIRGIDTIIIDGLRHRPHGAHFTIEQSLFQLEAIRPKKAYLTHLAHELDFDETSHFVKQNSKLDVEIAYDEMEFELPGSPFLS